MQLTVQTIQKVMPAGLRGSITQAMVDRINASVSDPFEADVIRDNFLSFTSVLQDGKFKTEDYLSAVKYVSYQLLKNSNQDSYIKTFPDRYQAMLAAGKTAKEISSMVAAYNKGLLVNKIREQTLVPTWVLNADKHQEAINVLASEMYSAKSDMARITAAGMLLSNLSKPKDVGPLIAVEVNNNSGMNELTATLAKLAQQQQDMIRAGVSPAVIAGQALSKSEDVIDV